MRRQAPRSQGFLRALEQRLELGVGPTPGTGGGLVQGGLVGSSPSPGRVGLPWVRRRRRREVPLPRCQPARSRHSDRRCPLRPVPRRETLPGSGPRTCYRGRPPPRPPRTEALAPEACLESPVQRIAAAVIAPRGPGPLPVPARNCPHEGRATPPSSVELRPSAGRCSPASAGTTSLRRSPPRCSPGTPLAIAAPLGPARAWPPSATREGRSLLRSTFADDPRDRSRSPTAPLLL